MIGIIITAVFPLYGSSAFERRTATHYPTAYATLKISPSHEESLAAAVLDENILMIATRWHRIKT